MRGVSEEAFLGVIPSGTEAGTNKGSPWVISRSHLHSSNLKHHGRKPVTAFLWDEIDRVRCGFFCGIERSVPVKREPYSFVM